ncbi:hypothetical protein ACEZCY_12925 [Streptacidiphilus sp. N1-12]|uniref:Uncharacterized protein n=2 Tax=Streptacidiphilus alkalitolerans TaxID=3342712 RepID=A0ABV6WDS0_9ACTN
MDDQDAEGTADALPGLMALPDRTEDGEQQFLLCLRDVVRALGLDVDPEPGPDPDPYGRWTWGQHVRAAIRDACRQGLILSEASFDALIKAAVTDPDPSYDRWFVEPALNAFGYLRVRSALLAYLRTGTNPERAGAARVRQQRAPGRSPLPPPRPAAAQVGVPGSTARPRGRGRGHRTLAPGRVHPPPRGRTGPQLKQQLGGVDRTPVRRAR